MYKIELRLKILALVRDYHAQEWRKKLLNLAKRTSLTLGAFSINQSW